MNWMMCRVQFLVNEGHATLRFVGESAGLTLSSRQMVYEMIVHHRTKAENQFNYSHYTHYFDLPVELRCFKIAFSHLDNIHFFSK